MRMPIEDSVNFSNETLKNISLLFSKQYSQLNHISFYNYKGKYNLLVRNLSSDSVDLEKLYKIIFCKNTTDKFIAYGIEESDIFSYKIALNRKHGPNKHILIEGDNVKVLFRSKDTLQIRGDFYNVSLGKEGSYVNEGIYLNDESFFGKPVELEISFFNRLNGLNLFVVSSINGKLNTSNRLPSW
jgi:hypothetical protein